MKICSFLVLFLIFTFLFLIGIEHAPNMYAANTHVLGVDMLIK